MRDIDLFRLSIRAFNSQVDACNIREIETAAVIFL